MRKGRHLNNRGWVLINQRPVWYHCAMTRSEFLAEVAKAEKRARKRRRPRVMAETSLDALAAAREADPTRGVRAARLVPRCNKIKRSDGRLCKSPCVRGGTRCWRHGGLRQVPDHPGNVRRLLGGVYARQTAYRLELKTLGEYWDLLTTEEQRDVQSHFIPKVRSDLKLLDWAARFYLSRFDDQGNGWRAFMKQMRGRRLLASQA